MYVLTFGRRFYFLSKILQLYPLSIPKQRQKKKREKKRKKGNAIVFSMDLVGRPALPPKNLVARPKISREKQNGKMGITSQCQMEYGSSGTLFGNRKKKTICKWIAGEKREEGPSARLMVHARRRSRVVFLYLLIPSRVFNSVSLSPVSFRNDWTSIVHLPLGYFGWVDCAADRPFR